MAINYSRETREQAIGNRQQAIGNRQQGRELFLPFNWGRKALLRCSQVGILVTSLSLAVTAPAWSQSSPTETNTIFLEERQLSQVEETREAQELDFSPEIIENSPVLQEWLEEVPNVLAEIRNDPSFRTKLRLGYSQFPSTGQSAGFNLGIEDLFIGRTGLTVSGDYQASFNNEREAFGTELRYYVLPLGGYVNVAPVVGYRNLTTGDFSTDGPNIGVRLLLVLSRPSAADISLTQTFVSPGSSEEVGITTLSFGYAVTQNLRVSTDIQKQNSRAEKDSRVGIVLEWMP